MSRIHPDFSIDIQDLIDDAIVEIKDGALGESIRQALSDQLIEELNLAVEDVDGIEETLREALETSDGELTLHEAFKALLRLVEDVERAERMDIDVAREVLDEEALGVLKRTLSLYLEWYGPETVGNERMVAEVDGIIREEDTYEFYAVRSEPEGSREEWHEQVEAYRIKEVFETAREKSYDYYEHFDADAEQVFEAIESVVRETGILEQATFEPDESVVQLDVNDALRVELSDLDVEVVVNDQGVFIDRVDEKRENLQAVRWDDLPEGANS